MPKLGPLELLVILIVVLIIFGPKNLPKLGSAIGKSVKNLREGMNSGKKEKEEVEAKAAASETKNEEEAEVVVESKPAPKSQAKDEEADE